MRIARLIVLLSLTTLAAASACAQGYPNRPVRFLVGFAPGGFTDVMARLIAGKLTEQWGHQVVVDNRPGASTTIAADLTAKAAPDGYTLLMMTDNHVTNPALFAKLPYDSERDFAPVTLAALAPFLLVVHPSVPAGTVKELIALAKARPGQLSYGSGGVGAPGHLSGELFGTLAGVKMVHVPYKGGSAVVVDLMSGQLQLTFGSTTSLPAIRSGRLVGLAVTTSRRVAALPELPTVAEAGLAGYEAAAWYAVFAPARTPRAIVDKVSAEFARAIRLPDVRERIEPQLIQPVGSSPAELAAFLGKELKKWGAIVKESGAKVE
jgi:tripartite-type tricarboxylate transporter receptor subunit TctC